VFVYLDDVLIATKTIEEGKMILKSVLEKFASINMKIKPSKCAFFKKEVEYLGFIITGEGTKPAERKLTAVKEFPPPKDKRGIKSFLGLAGFFRKFIPNFSKVAKPMTKLLKKEVDFKWTEEQEKAFISLKGFLTSAPIVRHPNMNKPFIMETDSSKEGVGAVLMQYGEDEITPHVIGYQSRAVNEHESRYGITELEMLGIIFGLHKWRYLLRNGPRVVIYTDHQALPQLLCRKTPPSEKFYRYKILLMEYDFELCYKPGKTNSIADALSRAPRWPKPLEAMPEVDEEWRINMIGWTGPAAEEKEVLLAKIKEEQDKDPILGEWKRALASGSAGLPETEGARRYYTRYAPYLHIFDDMLMFDFIKSHKKRKIARKQQKDEISGTLQEVRGGNYKLVVPRVMIAAVLQFHHDSIFGGHQDYDRTSALVREKFFWPGMHSDILHYCASCDTCQRSKYKHTKAIPLTPVEPPDQPWQRINMDVLTISTIPTPPL
jgi:hypothetical protein